MTTMTCAVHVLIHMLQCRDRTMSQPPQRSVVMCNIAIQTYASCGNTPLSAHDKAPVCKFMIDTAATYVREQYKVSIRQRSWNMLTIEHSQEACLNC